MIDGLPNLPKTCTQSGCNNEAHSVYVVVADSEGKTKRGVLSQFCHRRGRKRELKPGYTFLRWSAHCVDHLPGVAA